MLTCLLGQNGPRLHHELLEDGLERLILLLQLVDLGTRLLLFLMVLRPRLRLLLLHHLHHGLLVLLVRLWAGQLGQSDARQIVAGTSCRSWRRHLWLGCRLTD